MTAYPCAPIEYGQLFNIDDAWLRPKVQENVAFMVQYEQYIRDTRNADRRSLAQTVLEKYIYPPARFTQRTQPGNLPHPFLNDHNDYVKYGGLLSPFPPTNYWPNRHPWVHQAIPDFQDAPRWLDLSQFILNPYFRMSRTRQMVQQLAGRSRASLFSTKCGWHQST
jgi:hypothetical protein